MRVRKDGGPARPDEPGDIVQQVELKQLPTNKTYGLMELARGTMPQVGQNPVVFSRPAGVVQLLPSNPNGRHPSGSMLAVDNFDSDPPYSDNGVAFDGDRPVDLSTIAHCYNQGISRAMASRPGRWQRPWRPRER